MENNKNDQLVKGQGSLTELFRQSLDRKECERITEISIFTGTVASENEIKSEVKKLMAAFPDVKSDFLIVLVERMIDKNFTKERVKEAINHVIDTNPYKRPSIADIISFDRKIKVYTYSEISAKCYPGYSAFDHFEKIEIEGRKRYIEK